MTNISKSLQAVFTASAMAAGGTFFAAASGCSTQPKFDYKASMTKEYCKQGDNYRIFVFSLKLFDLPLLPNPAHNGIIFVSNDRDDFSHIINGVAINRQNGIIDLNGDNQDVLQTIPTSDANLDGIEAEVMVTEIYHGSFDDVMKKLRIALDATAFINRQNMAYDMFEIFGTAQNSNSAAYTLMTAMGLELPERHNKYMMPGHGRLLLPKGWRSVYEDWEPPIKSLEFQLWHVQQMYTQVFNEAEFSRTNTPVPGRPIFFNPEKPFMPYKPIVITGIEAVWSWHLEKEAKEKEEKRLKEEAAVYVMQYNVTQMIGEFDLKP